MLHVRSCIGRADDLLSGRSYYMVEVESLVDLVRAAQDDTPHLVLLDELFRGTNAVERIAAGQAVLRELVTGGGHSRHIVIAATHDGELVDLLPDSFVAVHFGDTVIEDAMVFNYRLEPGRATSRNAIALLEMHGAPGRMVQDARSCAMALDKARAPSSL
jgi:DNA mismatch repair ATPase MutS